MTQPNRQEVREIMSPVQLFGPGQRPGDVDYAPHVLDSKDPLDPAQLQGGVEVPKASSAPASAETTPSTEDGSIPEPPDLTVPVDEGPPQPISASSGSETQTTSTPTTTTTTPDPEHPSSTSQKKTSPGSDVPPAPTAPSSPTQTSSTPVGQK